MELKNKTKFRRWVFTLNNPKKTLEELKNHLANNWKIDYLIIGNEKGEEKNTQHYQGYIEFSAQANFDQVKERLEGAHIEEALGSPQKNRLYCSKQNDFVEYGTIKASPQNNDLASSVIGYLEQGLTPVEIATMFNELADYIVKNYRNLEAISQSIRFNAYKAKEEK